MARKGQPKGPHIYWRNGRAYGDFRKYRHLTGGSGRESLREAEGQLATTDPEVAQVLFSHRLAELVEENRTGRITGRKRTPMRDFFEHHLKRRDRDDNVTDGWSDQNALYLDRAAQFFASQRRERGDDWGMNRDLSTIGADDIREWIADLRHPEGIWNAVEEQLAERNRKRRRHSGGFSDTSIHHHLAALSLAFERAMHEGRLRDNPFNQIKRPTPSTEREGWLEVPDAGLLLEAAALYTPKEDRALRCMHEIIATLLLTGGRKSEVLGLEVNDISFDAKRVYFRPNKWRRLKSKTSSRQVPLWPQLEEVLRAYLEGPNAPTGRLLFPSSRTNGSESPITDLRKPFDAIVSIAGVELAKSCGNPGRVNLKALRHTYCSARLQTLDHGAAVALFTVAGEMGHSSIDLVERVYGHLGEIRHRGDSVEYRLNAFVSRLNGRIEAMRDRAQAHAHSSNLPVTASG